MPLKKKVISLEEVSIFDEAIVYKRGDYWHFRMWLSKESKYARAAAPHRRAQRHRTAAEARPGARVPLAAARPGGPRAVAG